ncbi:MAG: hypothetical protein CSA58_05975 [Micrococcales bacterium]|nr:MAG: hypothetical protein CSA58_05975 [Micrococcales bacterium]
MTSARSIVMAAGVTIAAGMLAACSSEEPAASSVEPTTTFTRDGSAWQGSKVSHEKPAGTTDLTRGGAAASTTLERRAIELFSQLDAEQREGDAVIDLPENALFDFGKDELKPDSAQTIADLVELAKLTGDTPIHITGHTDGVGSDEVNQALSEQRAQTMADTLISKGVQESRITSKGAGSSQPVAEEGGADDKQARAKNRRVEVLFEGLDIEQ